MRFGDQFPSGPGDGSPGINPWEPGTLIGRVTEVSDDVNPPSAADPIQAAVPGAAVPSDAASRPATNGDVPAITELLRAEEIAGTGETSLSETEVGEWFDTPRARERNVVRVLERAGVLIGVWRVFRNFEDKYWAQVAVDRGLPGALVDELWVAGLDWAERTTVALADGFGVTNPRLDLWVYEDDALTRRHAEASGFRQMRAFIEMQIDLDGYIAPDPDPAVLVRHAAVADAGSPDLATMYHVLTESFRDHYDFQLRSFEDWLEAKEADALADPSHWYLAELDGAAVGALKGTTPTSRSTTPVTSPASACCARGADAGSRRRCCTPASPATPPTAGRPSNCTWTPRARPAPPTCTSRSACTGGWSGSTSTSGSTPPESETRGPVDPQGRDTLPVAHWPADVVLAVQRCRANAARTTSTTPAGSAVTSPAGIGRTAQPAALRRA